MTRMLRSSAIEDPFRFFACADMGGLIARLPALKRGSCLRQLSYRGVLSFGEEGCIDPVIGQ